MSAEVSGRTGDEDSPKRVDQFIKELNTASDALQAKNVSEVVSIAQEIVSASPDSPYGYLLLAVASELSNERAQAIEMLLRAHEMDPDCREYAECLATLYASSGKLADGVYFIKLADALTSIPEILHVIPKYMLNYADAMNHVQVSRHFIEAMRAYNLTEYETCVQECMRELRHNKLHDKASELLGRAFLKTDRPGRAISAFHAVLHIDPSNAMAYAGLGEARLRLGHYVDATTCFLRAVDLEPSNAAVICRVQQGLARMPYGADVHMPVKRWLDAMREDLAHFNPPEERTKGAPLRVGIVSDMFYSSPIHPYFIHLLENSNPRAVEVRLYSLGKCVDAMTSRVQNATQTWRELTDIDQFTLAETLRREQLDVMIDLSVEPETQAMEMLAAGVAPIQVSWFGRPEAAGLPGVTHIVSDSWTKQAEEGRLLDGQTYLLPEHGFLSREPYFTFDEPLPSPVEDNGYVMFGMRADGGAITPDDAIAVADLLRAVPGSYLMLGLTCRIDQETQQRLVDLFALGGVADRIVLQDAPGSSDSPGNFQNVVMDFFADVDVFIVPSSSGTFDDVALALWMGAPAIACCGQTRLTMLPASALAQAGRDEWIAQTPQDLVRIGQELAGDQQRLAALRQSLREEALSSNLFMTKKVAQGLWASLLEICKG